MANRGSGRRQSQDTTQKLDQQIQEKPEKSEDSSSDFSYYLMDLSNRVDLVQKMCVSKQSIDFTAIVVAFLNMRQADILQRRSLSTNPDLDDIFDSVIALSLRFKKKLESVLDSFD